MKLVFMKKNEKPRRRIGMINNSYIKLYEALLTEAKRGKRQPQRDPNPLGGRGIPRHGLGTPSHAEKKLGVYVRTTGADQADVGTGVGGQDEVLTSKGVKIGGGFTRIRREDRPDVRGTTTTSGRTTMTRVRKGKKGGKLLSGGTGKLKRKLQSSQYTPGEKGEILRQLNKKLVAGKERWKAGINDSVQATLPFPEKNPDDAKKRIKASLDTIRKQGKLSLLFRGFSKGKPVRTEK